MNELPLAMVDPSLGVVMAAPVLGFLGFGAVILLGFHLIRKLGK